jgi:methylmalonyl-CoA/ethylmalonyl-CoA epimerase
MSSGKNLHMPRLSQIGIYVKNMEESIEQYEKVFGIGPWLVLEGETEYCLDRGREVTVTGRIGMGYTGKIQLELIQIIAGSNLYLDTLGDRDEGLHHLGFEVDNLEERLQACREAGIEVLQRGTLKQLGLTIDYAYLDTLDSVGVILEFIQTRFLGLKIRQRPGMLNLVARIQNRFGFP